LKLEKGQEVVRKETKDFRERMVENKKIEN
jgi:hypothetical protein